MNDIIVEEENTFYEIDPQCSVEEAVQEIYYPVCTKTQTICNRKERDARQNNKIMLLFFFLIWKNLYSLYR